MSLKTEIHEQPDVLERLLREQLEPSREIATAVAKREIRTVFVAARGTSDNAALYGKYLCGFMNHVQVALATPSLFTIYNSPPRLDGSLVVGISQSGESPDIVNVVKEGRAQGALTLAITNEPRSPLASQAELVLETLAGPERAVAATKTYTAQLLAIALLCTAARDDAERLSELERVPDLVRGVLGLDETIRGGSRALPLHEAVCGPGARLQLRDRLRVVPEAQGDDLHRGRTLFFGGLPARAGGRSSRTASRSWRWLLVERFSRTSCRCSSRWRLSTGPSCWWCRTRKEPSIWRRRRFDCPRICPSG